MRWRKIVLVVMDTVLLSAAYVFAFWLRLGWEGTLFFGDAILRTLPVILPISLFVHMRFGLFNAILRYASIETASAVLRSVTLSVLLSCLVLFLLFRLDGVPRSVFVIYAMAAVLLVGGARFAVRSWQKNGQPPKDRTRVVLYGAGDTAELVLRGLRQAPEIPYEAVALLDDDRGKHGRQIHGVKVHGALEAQGEVAHRFGAEELWVCIPKLRGDRLRQAYQAGSHLGIRVKILPRLDHSLLGTDIARFQEPDIADLLRRPPRSLDQEGMRAWVRGRRVLITGAGGSIGSELVRQVARLEPADLALCDASESNLFEITRRVFSLNGSVRWAPFLVDVRNAGCVRRMFEQARPEIVFHAAAYKHVPLVELNPSEGVLTNVKGLSNVATAAIDCGAEELVFISTDKAVRPANVMGATKRLGEMIVQVLDGRSKTRLCAVRFGNVLGSSGSVVPIFQEQIRRGGPVTVTHPEMTRYFMLVSEAAELVIQAAAIRRGGAVFVLNMGEAVRIAEMAADLIRLMGKEPGRDIPIEFTGTRPGEKVHEELLIDGLDARTSFHDIWIDGEAAPALEWPDLARRLERLFELARNGDRTGTLRALKELVPQFEPLHEETVAALRSRDRQRDDGATVRSDRCGQDLNTAADRLPARRDAPFLPRAESLS